MSEKSNSDHNKKSGGSSKNNPLADALERLERSVAQREGNRMASLVKPIKEEANESNEALSKKTSTAEEGVKEPSNSTNQKEINSNKTGYSAKLSFFIFSSFIVTALFIILGMVFWPYAKKLLNSELTAIHETAISDKEPEHLVSFGGISGGPSFDGFGNVNGVVVAESVRRGLLFAVSIEQISWLIAAANKGSVSPKYTKDKKGGNLSISLDSSSFSEVGDELRSNGIVSKVFCKV